MADSYARPDVLVSTDWVAEHLDDPSIMVVEVNTDLGAGYHLGHVPGAVAWDLHRDLEAQVARDIPGLSQIQELMGRSGHRQRHHRSPLRRRQQPFRDLGVLAAQALPPR